MYMVEVYSRYGGVATGIILMLTGADQCKDAFNAVNASYFLDTSTPKLKTRITYKIVDIIREVRRNGTPEELLASMSGVVIKGKIGSWIEAAI